MSTPQSDTTLSGPPPADTAAGLTKREYYAVHLFGAVTSTLSQYCTMQDKAQHAVDAADALIKALEEKGGA